MRLALAQFDFLVGDVPGNSRRVLSCVEQARDAGADLLLFPELALTGYPPEDLLLRPGFMRQVHEHLAMLTAEIHGPDVVLGHPWLEPATGHAAAEALPPSAKRSDQEAGVAAGRRFNSVSWLRNGQLLGRYHKQLLPNYAVFDEARYFVPGNSPLVIECAGVACGVLICEDAWQPEPAAQARTAGARLLLVPNASPYRDDKQSARETVFAARSRDTGLPMAYCNLVGGQDELVFDGRSALLGRDGLRQAQGGLCEEALLLADFNETSGDFTVIDSGNSVAQSADWKEHGAGGGTAPRRDPDAESAQASAAPWASAPQCMEQELYTVLQRGLRDYIHKNGFSEVVFGLSGGVDSALTLALAVDALGADKVHCVMMPSRHTSQLSLDLAREQAEALAVDYRTIEIEGAYAALMAGLAPSFRGVEADVTEENLQARIRGNLIMALSNKFGWLPLATSNKSELAVGYSTIYGDMCGGFSPLKDCLKTRVYDLCRWRNTVSQAIPQQVIDRPPSAELRPDQQDQDSLPPYPVLDAVLHRFVDQDWSIHDIVAEGFDEAMVRRVAGLVLINEYKRRQGAPGTRVTSRGFGRDRRYPITSGWREKA